MLEIISAIKQTTEMVGQIDLQEKEEDMQLNTTQNLTFVGWVILIGLLLLANRTKLGHRLIYYSLVIILLTLILGNYKRIIEYSFEGVQYYE